METLDWRMIGVLFNICQFIFMAIIFAVLKFNDMKHIESDLKGLKSEFHTYEMKNDERHIENLTALKELSEKVSFLSGKFDILEK